MATINMHLYKALHRFVAIFVHPNVSVPPFKTLATNMYCLRNFGKVKSDEITRSLW